MFGILWALAGVVVRTGSAIKEHVEDEKAAARTDDGYAYYDSHYIHRSTKTGNSIVNIFKLSKIDQQLYPELFENDDVELGEHVWIDSKTHRLVRNMSVINGQRKAKKEHEEYVERMKKEDEIRKEFNKDCDWCLPREVNKKYRVLSDGHIITDEEARHMFKIKWGVNNNVYYDSRDIDISDIICRSLLETEEGREYYYNIYKSKIRAGKYYDWI